MARLILMPICAGFIATAGITLVLWAINKTGWTNADMIRAIGSFFTKSYERSLGIGLVIHFGQGLIVRFADVHPVKEFQRADYQVAIAHTIGHVVYGMLMGAAFGTMRLLGFDVTPGF